MEFKRYLRDMDTNVQCEILFHLEIQTQGLNIFIRKCNEIFYLEFLDCPITQSANSLGLNAYFFENSHFSYELTNIFNHPPPHITAVQWPEFIFTYTNRKYIPEINQYNFAVI